VREHEVYAIGYPGDFTGTQKRFQAKSESKFAEIIGMVRGKAKRNWGISQVWFKETTAHLREVFDNASNNKKALYIGAIALPVLLLVLLVIRLSYLDPEPVKPAAKMVAATSSVAAPPLAAAKSGLSSASSPQSASHVADVAAKQVQSVQESKSSEVVANSAINANKPVTRETVKSDSFKVVESSVVAKANVILKIKPWGEVYVDGQMVGVSPPLTKLQVAPGEHVIEVRNTTFPVSTRVVNVKAGMKITVKHKFGN
jgi:hypothetical protein